MSEMPLGGGGGPGGGGGLAPRPAGRRIRAGPAKSTAATASGVKTRRETEADRARRDARLTSWPKTCGSSYYLPAAKHERRALTESVEAARALSVRSLKMTERKLPGRLPGVSIQAQQPGAEELCRSLPKCCELAMVGDDVGQPPGRRAKRHAHRRREGEQGNAMQEGRRSGQVKPQPAHQAGADSDSRTPRSGGLPSAQKLAPATRHCSWPAAPRKATQRSGPSSLVVKNRKPRRLGAQGRRHRQYCLTGPPAPGLIEGNQVQDNASLKRTDPRT